MLCVLLLPVLFVPLFGYAVAAVRAAQRDARQGPPPWRWSRRLFSDGAWTALWLALSVLPFALIYTMVAAALQATPLDGAVAHVLAALVAALPWGVGVLLLLPHASARFAITGAASDLFDVRRALHDVRTGFASWNVAVAAIVTGWAIGTAAIGLLCVGVVPGVFYAILVSAHAAATLQREGPASSAR